LGQTNSQVLGGKRRQGGQTLCVTNEAETPRNWGAEEIKRIRNREGTMQEGGISEADNRVRKEILGDNPEDKTRKKDTNSTKGTGSRLGGGGKKSFDTSETAKGASARNMKGHRSSKKALERSINR